MNKLLGVCVAIFVVLFAALPMLDKTEAKENKPVQQTNRLSVSYSGMVGQNTMYIVYDYETKSELLVIAGITTQGGVAIHKLRTKY